MTLEQQKENKPSFFERMKTRWNVESNLSILLILLAFSLNGSFAVWIAKPVLSFFNVNKETLNPWLYYPIRIGLILPIYQLTLPLVGALLGQFNFFWAFQKKTIGRLFGIKSQK